MRKQYHSRVVNGQRYIWDVHKLVEASREFPVKDIPLGSIKELDGNHWYDSGSKPPTPREVAVHAKLIQECDMRYPIILSADSHVMDGMHRCCRALIEKAQFIKAVQFAVDPEPDYIDVALEDLPNDKPVTL